MIIITKVKNALKLQDSYHNLFLKLKINQQRCVNKKNCLKQKYLDYFTQKCTNLKVDFIFHIILVDHKRTKTQSSPLRKDDKKELLKANAT